MSHQTVFEIWDGSNWSNIFDDKIRNNRIRLCDSINKVGKPCMRLGWFNISDLIFE